MEVENEKEKEPGKPGTSSEGHLDKDKSSSEQTSNGDQKLPATGHSTNWLPLLGGILILLGIRLRFITKRV
ncbi:LPXTG cell wall anchor domain-containing protein [Bacillus bingmayongensis]|uniref:LPXTG cell wall anchor domain-containing protein n=1 Tax=Bacillus bingmayongensis TaxID=1150157 RepID=UPI0002D41CFB|nr:LPXTG cell wall anchor domain-containing protein [Bacillus bingmayongensis]MBY0596615.1 LPXTG cell wall anchor domain-containing protein [Bacillus bingmayongensis]